VARIGKVRAHVAALRRAPAPRVLSADKGRWAHGWLLLLAMCFIGSGCERPGLADGAQQSVPVVADIPDAASCPLNRPKTRRKDLVLSATDGFPCDIIALDLSVQLGPAEDGSHPDPSALLHSIAMDRRGRIFTSAAYDPVVLVWDSTGRFVTALGKVGQGPGEFARRSLLLMTTQADSLIVRDGAGRWLVFDPDLQFTRLFAAAGMPGLTAHVTEAGHLLFSTPVPGGAPNGVFHLSDGEARLLRSVEGDRGTVGRSLRAPRVSAYAGGGEVWVAPAKGSGRGYVLERWTVDGELLQVLKRPLPWLPLDGYADDPSIPDFKFLNVDEVGLLWVAVAVKDPRWTPPYPGMHPDENASERYDLRLEVIDPEAGEVLASVRIDGEGPNGGVPPVYPVGRGSRRSVGLKIDVLGRATLRLHELHLVRR
jgi:hypothetical protein